VTSRYRPISTREPILNQLQALGNAAGAIDLRDLDAARDLAARLQLTELVEWIDDNPLTFTIGTFYGFRDPVTGATFYIQEGVKP